MNVFDLVATLSLDSTKYENELDNAENKGSKFGSGLKTAAAVGASALAATTAAAVAFGKSSVDAGMNFDTAMSKVQSISGATGKDFDDLRAKAQEMGSKTKFSASESAEAFSYMAMAGWKTGEMLDGIEGLMNLAAASGESLASTSDIVTDALTAFGLKAKDSGHFADIMAAASSNANTNVKLMGETFKYVAPVAGSLGVSAEDTAEAIGLMANAGIKGSQAGTSLRSILTRLSTDAGASSKSLGALGVLTKELGVDFYDANGKVRDFSDILDDARVQWKTLSVEDAANFANKIAGQEGISAWLALMNSTDEDVEKLRTSIDECDDAALRMADNMQDNLAGDITIFKSALEGAQIAISDKLTPALRDFVQTGTNGISEVTAAFKEKGLTGAMKALGEWLSKAISMIIDKVPAIIDAGTQLLLALVKGLVDNLSKITQAAIQVITTLAKGISEALPELIPATVEAIITIVQTLIDNLPQLIDAALQLMIGFAQGLVNAIPKIIEKLPEIITAIVNALINSAPKIAEAGVSLFTALVQNLPQILSGILKAVSSILENIFTAIKNGFPDIIKIGENLIGKLGEGIKGAYETVKGWGKGVVDKLREGITKFADNVKNAASSVVGRLYEGVKDRYNDLKTIGGNILGKVKEGITSFADKVKEVGGPIISNIGQGLKDKLSMLPNVFRYIVVSIANGITGFADQMKTAGGNLLTGLANGLIEKWNSIANTVRNVGSNVLNTFKGIFGIASPSKVFKQYGKFMMEGLADGIMDNIGMVDDAMDDLDDVMSDDFDDILNSDKVVSIDTGNGDKSSVKSNTEVLLEKILDAMQSIGITLDGETLVGQLTPNINNNLGMLTYYQNREALA